MRPHTHTRELKNDVNGRTYVELVEVLLDLLPQGLGLVLGLGEREVGLRLGDLLLGVGDDGAHVRVGRIGLESGHEDLELLERLRGGVEVLLVMPRLDEVLCGRWRTDAQV